MIKTIYFDLGGVLVNFSLDKMCENIGRFCGLDFDIVKAYIYDKGLGRQYEEGAIESKTIHAHFAELAKRPLDYEGLMHAASSIFSLKEETLPIVEKLKRQNFSLYILSNTCEAHFKRIQKDYPFLELFDGFVLSYEVKARKPDKAIFDAALEMGDTKPEESFYIDDIPEYVDAAREYGIRAHPFTGSESLVDALEKQNINLSP